MMPPPPRSTLFPYTTLFRSVPIRILEPRHPRSAGRIPDAKLILLHPRISLQAHAGLLQAPGRSEEHTSELQSREKLVCRRLLEKQNFSWAFKAIIKFTLISC